MSQSSKRDLLRFDQRVIGADKIRKVLAQHHPALDEVTRRIHHLSREPLTVVVMGEFSAGKSSFLNRLLGTDALPVAILPKTATLTRLVHGEPDVLGTVEIDREGDEGIETSAISLQEFADLQRAAKLHDITVVQDLARIREVCVFLNDPLLDKLQLVDTPGFNHDEAMDNCTLGILDRADLVLWITDALQPAKQTEFEKLRLLKERGKRLWLIVNKADVNVTDATAWEESRQSLEQYFRDIGFLDFFESRRVELISCRQTDDFWIQQFEHTKARLGTDIFNLDMWWSSNLVGDEWQRLGAALQDEDERYRELERRCASLQELTDASNLADRCLDDLNDEAITPHLSDLEWALSQHGAQGRQAAKLNIESVTTFAMEYTRAPLVSAFEALTQIYGDWLLKWQVDYLKNVIALLKVIQAILPREHGSLSAEVLTLREHRRLLLERLSQSANRSRVCSLPALDRTVELLAHLQVQFESITWQFSLRVEEEGVLQPDSPGASLVFPEYCRRQLLAALKRDFQTDLEHIVREPACLGLLEHLTNLCQGMGERLTQARQIWSNHDATCLDAD